jgi:dTDP-4-amino-4,6-dideoxygalactose transaminase
MKASMHVPYVDLGSQWMAIKDRALPTISEVLETGMYLEHPIVRALEQRIANRLGVKFATSVNSGTDALIFALAALGVSRGDEVITVPNSFIASVAAIEHVGATTVFVDVGPDHLINTELIEQEISPRTKVIMPVHLEGKMADMVTINRIAKKHGLKVIEDAAQAFGSKFLEHQPGNLSDVACFSFHPLKNLNAVGDGGLVVSNNNELIERVNVLKNHGQVSRNISLNFGFVSRLDSLQAAILNIKLDDVDSIITRRRLTAKTYETNLEGCEIQNPIISSGVFHSYHLYVIEIDDRDHIQEALKIAGVETKIHYPILIPDQTAYTSRHPDKKWNLPEAEKQCKRILSLPIHENLSSLQVDYVSGQLRNLL